MTNDPMAGFIQPNNTPSFDFNPPQAQQMQQRMQNGNPVNGSPASLNAMYQTSSTIPSKRPRAREDSVGGSPQLYPNSLPVSRSQTPHGSYPGFAGPVNGTPFQGHPTYQNLQSNAPATSQSPSAQAQPFQPPATQQPSPFSPAPQNFTGHGSPPQSEGSSRVNTPQNGVPNYPQNIQYGMGPSQAYPPHAVPAVNGGPQPSYGQYPPHEQQMLRQANQIAAMRGNTNASGLPVNQSVQLPNQLSNVQMGQIRAHQLQQGNARNALVNQQVANALLNFCRQRNIPFEQQPVIAGKPQNTVHLFVGVSKMGGSKKIAAAQQWSHVAHLLQYPQPIQVQAGHELQAFWQRHLAEFEAHWAQFQQHQYRQTQQQQQQQQQQQHQQQQHQQQQQQLQLQQRQQLAAESMRNLNTPPRADPTARASHFSQPGLMPDQTGGLMQPPAKQIPNAAQINGRPASNNGQAEPGRPAAQAASPALHTKGTTEMLGQISPDKSQRKHRTAPGTVTKNGEGATQTPRPLRPEDWGRRASLPELFAPGAFRQILSVSQKRSGENDEGSPSKKGDGDIVLSRHGGQPIEDADFQRSVESLLKYKLRGPLLLELGPIDIRALTLSLRSGLKGEVRHALDTLISLSEPQQTQMQAPLSLDQCDDLVQALTECGMEQAELLAAHASEVSDVIEIYPYEDTVRACKFEVNSFQEPKSFGSVECDLENAVERLLSITRIFKDFAAFDTSFRALADPVVSKMLATVIRQIGIRNMMLQSHQNILEFCKHVVLFFSHMSQYLDFQSKDDAASVLHFLISFAPLPDPYEHPGEFKAFSSYTASLNQYLPHAVDALAKLLTRDKNRKFYRSILTTEPSSSPAYELLTRAFGLAISVIPADESITNINILTHRISFMTQGLLVAEILIGMIPGNEHALAASWLSSEDQFAQRLLRMLRLFAQYLEQAPHPQGHPQYQHRDVVDAYGHAMITNRGLAFLKKLIMKAKENTSPAYVLPDGIFPGVKTILAALGNERINPEISRQLCSLADLSA